MTSKWAIIILLLLTGISCRKETLPRFAICNSLVTACSSGDNGQYCTLGYKFGEPNPFSPAGMEVPGPQVGATVITYTFLDGNIPFATSAADGLISRTFSDPEKSGIRTILAEWEAAADITFQELNSTDKSDITIILADIAQGGLGYPPLVGEPCSQLSGYLVLSSKTSSRKNITIHEVGHVLGLGHVVSNNVMNPNQLYEHLQPGDIEGVQSIYGTK